MAIVFDEGEHIVLEVRKHWFSLFSQIFVVTLLAIVPLGVIVNLEILPIKLVTSGSTFALSLFLYFGWLLVLWLYSFYVWTDYFLDIWIITNKKILAVEQTGFFGRKVSTMAHIKVQNVATEAHGMIATLMGFGRLQVETAGHDQDFIMDYVANPDETRHKISEVLSKYHDSVDAHQI